MGHSSIGYGVPSFRVWCSSACKFFPSNSAGSSYPSMRAAEGFEKRQVPDESQPQIASAAESSIKRIRSSLLRNASSARIRIALSSGCAMADAVSPLQERVDHEVGAEHAKREKYIERHLRLPKTDADPAAASLALERGRQKV